MNENHDNEQKHESVENAKEYPPPYDSHNVYPRSPFTYDEEFSADLLNLDRETYASGDSTTGAVILGFIGLAATVFALFNYSLILGAVGILLGCYSVAKGAKVLGVITIGVGLLAVAFQVFNIGPFTSLF